MDSATPPAPYVYSANDFGPRAKEERDLCATADHPDWLYLGGLLALNAGSALFDAKVLKYGAESGAVRLVGAGVAGLTWGAFVTGAFLSLPKCDPQWVSGHPAEGAVRSRLPLAIALSTLAVATAPFFVFVEIGPIPNNWSVGERTGRVLLPMATGLLGSLVPYIEFLAPKTWRAALKLERIRLEGAPVPPSSAGYGVSPAVVSSVSGGAPAGFMLGYSARF